MSLLPRSCPMCHTIGPEHASTCTYTGRLAGDPPPLLAATPPPPVMAAVVRRVHDGDTFIADCDLGIPHGWGLRLWAHDQILRVDRCNARELGQLGGPEAAANLAGILPPGTPINIAVRRWDEYGGRHDADITLPDGADLADTLIAAGWAARWNGRGPKPLPPWPRPS